MRTCVRIIICVGVVSLTAGCIGKFSKDRPVVQPQGAVTHVESKSKQTTESEISAAKSSARESAAVAALKRVAEITKSVASGDADRVTNKPSGDAFLDAVADLIAADTQVSLVAAIDHLRLAMAKTKKGSARHNLGSILLNEAGARRALARSEHEKESEIARLQRETFLLKQKLAETEAKLRELASIEDEISRSKNKSEPQTQ